MTNEAPTNREVLLSKKVSINVNIKGVGGSAVQLQNYISTAKYSRWSFLGYFLYEQFKKAANALTLFVGAVSWVPKITTTFKGGPWIPLGFILSLALFKELYEDRKRRLSDQEINHKNVLVLERDQKCTIIWEQLAVGNVVLLQQGDHLPADLIILATSEPQAICYVNTVELDGETNLKIRSAINWTHQTYCRAPEQLSTVQMQCLVEEPNDRLYSFSGKLLIESFGVINVTEDNILLRGTSLENTQWVYGLVVYAGYDCKVQKNLRSIPLKISPSQQKVNLQTMFLFTILIIMCLVHCIGSMIWNKRMQKTQLYAQSESLNFFEQLLKTFLLYNAIIPISLTITLEFVKFFQSRFIESDPDLMDKESGRKPKVVCSDLMDCLGQINIILTDKTGTLTQNVMVLKKCLVDGEVYVHENGNEEQQPLIKTLLEQYEINGSVQHIVNNIMCCNSVIPEEGGVFKSISSEEICMIEYMHEIGLTLLSRSLNQICIRFSKSKTVATFELLYSVEFSSARKKMTVIVRDESGSIFVYSKGADTAIIPCCIQTEEVELLNEKLSTLSKDGLRSLCFAYRQMSADEFMQLQSELLLFKAGRHPVYSDSGSFFDYFYAMIETNMHLLGLVALEDALQIGVPETIENLSIAGIKIWMLTGDKREIAVDVGILSGIIRPNYEIVHIEWTSVDEMKVSLVALINAFSQERKVCATFSGIDFDKIRAAPELVRLFVDFALRCNSVILYRATPMHKSKLAFLLKQRKSSWRILAIGDGANDVSMIREAHVGVGLMGKEGLQASRSSDFAIFQFKDLQKLLLVHGLWSYHRFSKVILYTFYKSIVVSFTQFLFGFDNGFSGANLFNRFDLIFYNLFYSSAPPMVLGTVEQFLPQSLLMSLPHLYKLGPSQRFLSEWSFWGAIANGIFHSCFTYYILRNIFYRDLILACGATGGKKFFSGVLFFCQLTTVCFKAALSTSTWNSLSLIGIIGSLVFYCAVAQLFELSTGLFGNMFTSEVFWVTIVAIPCGALMKDLLWKYLKQEYFPTSYHIALKQRNRSANALIYKQGDIEIREGDETTKEL